ncbi:metallopeptidase family protein [Candidatus Sumerlaeota bacterium]|nr:metallopeptidase family protein [Candidatus Sumerlaeota bacterium]
MSEDFENQLYELHDESDRLMGEGDVCGALTFAQRAHAFAVEHEAQISRAAQLDTLYLLVNVLLEAEQAREALSLCDEIQQIDPEDMEIALSRGIALLLLLRFDEAQSEFESYPHDSGGRAEALWHLAVLAEFRGDDEEAERLFAEAHRLDPDKVMMPVRMGADEVSRLLREVIDEMAEGPLGRLLENLVIQIERLPDPRILAECDPPLSPFILGLYQGTPWGDQSVFDQPHDLNRVLIFQRNIERVAADRGTLREQLIITLHHEIGHHSGWDEEDLAERGLD